MKLKKYCETLVLTEEQVAASLAPLRAKEMHKKGELEICKIDADIAEKEAYINQCTSHYPLDYEFILNQLDVLELLKRRKEEFEKLLRDLFDETKEAK